MNVEGKIKKLSILFYYTYSHIEGWVREEGRDKPEGRLEGQQFTKLPDPEKVDPLPLSHLHQKGIL
jgi:hypothetical protein